MGLYEASPVLRQARRTENRQRHLRTCGSASRLYAGVRGSCEGEHRPFREKPLCLVRSVPRDDSQRPRIEAVDDVLLVHIRLVKLGFGSFDQVRELDARTVLQALNYEKFCDDFDRAYGELNKK